MFAVQCPGVSPVGVSSPIVCTVVLTALGLSLLAVRRWRLVAFVKLTAARRRGAHRRRSTVGYVIHWRAARDEPSMARQQYV